jgi:hypothetical protein
MSGMTNPEKLFWLQFVKSFARVKENFTLNGTKRQFKEDDQISFDYEPYISEMRSGRFSRDVGALYFSVAEIPTGSDIVALVYAEEDAYGENPLIVYRIATYTKDGGIIDKQVIAGMDTYDELKTASFSKGNKITVKTYGVKYEKDPSENGYESNAVKSKTLVSTTVYTIMPGGEIGIADPV